MSGPWGEGKPGNPGHPSRARMWWLEWSPFLFVGIVAAIVVATAAGWL